MCDPLIGCFFHISYCVLGIGGALKQIWTSVNLGSKPMLHLSPLSISSADLGSEVETMKEMQKGVTSLKVVTLCVLGCFLVVVLLFFLLPWTFCTKESGTLTRLPLLDFYASSLVGFILSLKECCYKV